MHHVPYDISQFTKVSSAICR